MNLPRAARHRPPRPSGFTLVEVLVALFILALMASMAWQGVSQVLRSREVAGQRLDQLLRLQSAVAQWEADLGATIDTQLVPGLSFDGATLRLTRRQPGGAQVVAWTLREGRLQRWASPVLAEANQLQEGWLRSHQLLGGEAGTLTVLEPVEALQLFVFHASSNAWSNAQSSGDKAADGGSAGKAATTGRELLPDGVRLLLRFAPGAGNAGTLVRDVPLVHP